jgi:hypothetical protein
VLTVNVACDMATTSKVEFSKCKSEGETEKRVYRTNSLNKRNQICRSEDKTELARVVYEKSVVRYIVGEW